MSIRDLRISLNGDFEHAVFHDGYDHPAEDTLREALTGDEADEVMDWLISLVDGSDTFRGLDDLISCLRHLERPGTEEWRVKFVEIGLKSDDIRVRDAIMTTADCWDEQVVYDVLAEHIEPDGWLADYLKRVLELRYC